MAISIGSNFNLDSSTLPNFSRDNIASTTIANAASYPEGYIVFCTGDKKYYKCEISNGNKIWTEFQSGSGSSQFNARFANIANVITFTDLNDYVICHVSSNSTLQMDFQVINGCQHVLLVNSGSSALNVTISEPTLNSSPFIYCFFKPYDNSTLYLPVAAAIEVAASAIGPGSGYSYCMITTSAPIFPNS